jgi:hypothetical protein
MAVQRWEIRGGGYTKFGHGDELRYGVTIYPPISDDVEIEVVPAEDYDRLAEKQAYEKPWEPWPSNTEKALQQSINNEQHLREERDNLREELNQLRLVRDDQDRWITEYAAPKLYEVHQRAVKAETLLEEVQEDLDAAIEWNKRLARHMERQNDT